MTEAETDARTPTDPAVTLQVGVAAVCLVVQAWLVEYDAAGVRWVWLAVGALLLWLVHARRSQVARWLVVVPGLLGAVLYATSVIGGALPLGTGLLLVASFAGQAVAMLRPVVAEHCRTG